MKTFFQFLGEGLSEPNGTPSQTRIIGFFIAILFGVVMAAGFIYVLRWYPQFIIEYVLILAGLVAGLAGIKTVQTIMKKGTTGDESNSDK